MAKTPSTLERKWPTVLLSPISIADHIITVPSTSGLHTKQQVTLRLGSNADDFVIKRILSDTQIQVGKINTDFVNFENPIQFNGGSLEMYEQERNKMGWEIVGRAVYAEEPIVALRNILVDEFGQYFSTKNPIPVQLSDGSVNIGTVNAELEVQLSHKDNYPNPGDVADSVRIGDGVDELAINTNGSINAVLSNGIGALDTNSGPTGAQTLRTVSNIQRNGNELSYSFGVADANTLRIASLIGNTTGSADFNSGASTNQTLRAVSNIQRNGNELSYNFGVADINTLRIASLIGNATGAADFNFGASTNQTLRTASNLSDGYGNRIESALDVAGQRNLLVNVNHNIFVSAKNSSTTNLAAGASFVGLSENNLNATAIQVCILADQPLTVLLEQSNDGIVWQFPTVYTLDANQDDSRFTVASGSYVRVIITNNGTAATTYFNLQTILVPISSVLPQSLTDHGNLKTSIEEIGNGVEDKMLNADKAIYGQGITSSKISLLNANFRDALNTNDITASWTSSGSVTQSAGHAILSTGANATSSAKIVSNRVLKYAIQREAHIAADVSFTTPTNANSYQRFGLYNNDGFYIGYEGLIFGITHRVNGINAFIPLTSFNRDKLNGTSGSRFTRNKTPEAVKFNDFNTYRIRFGAASIVNFEIFNPDGQWITFHRIQFVNTSNTSPLYSTALPYTLEVSKNSSDSTDLQILTGAVDVSIIDNANAYGPEDVKGRKYLTFNVANQIASTTVYTVSPGRILKVTSLIVSATNSSLVTTGQLNIRDGNGGTLLIPLTTSMSTNQASSSSNLNESFPVPLRFSNAVFAQIERGLLTYSVTFVGYEAEG